MALARSPSSVLFACNLNRVRSPMAEGLMRLHRSAILVASCGIRRDPAESDGRGLDPFLAVVMSEVDVELGAHRSKTFEDLEDMSFDLMVSLTLEAHHHAVEVARRRGVAAEYWPTADPTLAMGPRDSILRTYRDVRGDLARRILDRFPLMAADD